MVRRSIILLCLGFSKWSTIKRTFDDGVWDENKLAFFHVFMDNVINEVNFFFNWIWVSMHLLDGLTRVTGLGH